MCRFIFRATEREKESIADNIVGFMKDTCDLSKESEHFICNWIGIGPYKNGKAYYDIWNRILDRYVPVQRPILFRSCRRVVKRPIQSFTGSMDTASRFSEGHTGHLLICDTKEYMRYLEFDSEPVVYRRNFFPICDLVRKDVFSRNPHFSQKFYDDYQGEDEYIVRVELSHLYDLKWNREAE